MSLPEWTIYAESTQWVGPVSVVAGGDTITDFELSVLPDGERPIGPWLTPVDGGMVGSTVTGKGLIVGPGSEMALNPGTFTVVAQYSTEAESPVFAVGIINVV